MKNLSKFAIIAMLLLGIVEVEARTVELGTHNTVILDRDLNYLTLDVFEPAAVAKRMFLPPNEVLYILIVSPGGQALAAYELLEFIESLPNVALICKNCNSGAAMIFAATTHPKLAINKSSAIMHEMYVPKMTARMMQDKKQTQATVKFSAEFDKLMADSLSMKLKDYQDKINNKEWAIKGKELVDFKMADELVDIICIGRLLQIAPDTCSK
jgi:ATP-dependent protease ClpP protease subunit